MADKDDVIYLETDEDITSAIDKLTKAAGDSVQIVAPKRSTLLQSVINLKLIKKAADDSGKQLVVVTNDQVAKNLAGRIGLPVASRVGEKGEVPIAPAAPDQSDEIEEGASDEPAAPEPEASKEPEDEPEPELAPEPDKPVIKRTPLEDAKPLNAAAAAAGAAVVPKNKKVPNFSALQKRTMWIAGGVAALFALIALNFYFTSATVTLYAKATQVDSAFDFKADPTASSSDPDAGILSANQLSESKTLSASVTATGTKDVGTKAHGNITVSNCYDNSPHTLVAGTRFQSPDGKIFRSDSDVTVPGGTGSFFGCTTPGKASVGVTADQNGDGYNLAAGTKYTIPALPASQQAGIYGTGDQISGGTTKNVQILTQADVDKAKQDALDKDKPIAAKELGDKAKSQKVIDASLDQKVTSVNSSPDVNEEAKQATLKIEVTYTELAVSKTDFSNLAKAQELKKIGGDNQIYDDGSDSATITKTGDNAFHVVATAFAGAKIDTTSLAHTLKGKKYGDAADMAARVPGVDKADVSITPAWATGMPMIEKHIHITIKANKSNS